MAEYAASQPALATKVARRPPGRLLPGIQYNESSVSKEKRQKQLQQLRNGLSAATHPPSSGVCHILRLAAETRLDIYRFVFNGAWVLVGLDHRSDEMFAKPRPGLYKKMSILFTCRTIYTEALAVLANVLHVRLRASRLDSQSIPRTVREHYFHLIQSLAVWPEAADFDPGTFPNLKQLHLHQTTDLSDAYDIVLEGYGSIRTHIDGFIARIHENSDQSIVDDWVSNYLADAVGAFGPATRRESLYFEKARVWKRNIIQQYYDKSRLYSMTSEVVVYTYIYLDGGFVTQSVCLRLVR